MIENSASISFDDTYQNLFADSHVPMLLVSPKNGEIVKANQAAVKFYGYEESQLTRLNISAINQLSPAQLKQEIRRAQKRKRSYFLFQHKLACGEIRDVEVYSSPVNFRGRELLFSVIHDITDRVKAEKQLNIYAQLFTSSIDMLTVIDNQYTYVAANPAYLEILGKPGEQVIGRHIKEVLGKEIYSSYLPYIKTAMDGELVQYERRFITPDNCAVDIETRYFPFFDYDGKQAGVIGVLRDISDQKQISEKLEYLAHHDILTNLPNRLLLRERLERHIQRAKRHDSVVYVVFIDLDRFKSINDSLGHSVGDALLISVAERLKHNIRSSDTVARVSGDEFIIAIEASEQAYEITHTLERLVESFNSPFCIENHSLYVTASIGVSQYPADSDNVNELISNADAAMYSAKQQGRNQFSFFSEGKADEIKKRTMMEKALRGALKRNEFELYFQPLVSLLQHQCIGLEVLLRWRNPEFPYITPNVFIPMAEQLGLMWELGSWILRNACEQGRKWQEAGVDFGKLAVNISGMQLRHINFYEEVKRILEQTKLSADKLELEITEDFIMNEADEGLRQLTALRQLGINIVIDDFGTGYSSLGHLKELPVNKLKIDRSFISDIEDGTDGKAITQSIIALGEAMNFKVSAEGVERTQQADTLLSQGCEQVQGFLYSKPMPADNITTWLKEHQGKL